MDADQQQGVDSVEQAHQQSLADAVRAKLWALRDAAGESLEPARRADDPARALAPSDAQLKR